MDTKKVPITNLVEQSDGSYIAEALLRPSRANERAHAMAHKKKAKDDDDEEDEDEEDEEESESKSKRKSKREKEEDLAGKPSPPSLDQKFVSFGKNALKGVLLTALVIFVGLYLIWLVTGWAPQNLKATLNDLSAPTPTPRPLTLNDRQEPRERRIIGFRDTKRETTVSCDGRRSGTFRCAESSTGWCKC